MNVKRVLVVDDDQDTCSNLADILTEFGYEVDVAYDGSTAIEFILEKKYRLALLDYRLPAITGVELFSRMRRVQRGLAGLLVTAFASNETTAEATEAGLQRVIHKPVDVPRLMPYVEQAFAG